MSVCKSKLFHFQENHITILDVPYFYGRSTVIEVPLHLICISCRNLIPRTGHVSQIVPISAEQVALADQSVLFSLLRL